MKKSRLMMGVNTGGIPVRYECYVLVRNTGHEKKFQGSEEKGEIRGSSI